MIKSLSLEERDEWRNKFLPDCTEEEIDRFRVRALITIDEYAMAAASEADIADEYIIKYNRIKKLYDKLVYEQH